MAEDFNKKLNDAINTADTTNSYDKNDIENNKVMALLSYLWILFLVPLFAAPNSKFARFHTNQGLVLFIFGLISGVIGGAVSFILALIPFIGWILAWVAGVIFGILEIGFILLAVLGIINALQGRAKELPVIGKIKILK